MPVKLTSLTTFPAGRILKLPSDGVLTEVTKPMMLSMSDCVLPVTTTNWPLLLSFTKSPTAKPVE